MNLVLSYEKEALKTFTGSRLAAVGKQHLVSSSVCSSGRWGNWTQLNIRYEIQGFLADGLCDQRLRVLKIWLRNARSGRASDLSGFWMRNQSCYGVCGFLAFLNSSCWSRPERIVQRQKWCRSFSTSFLWRSGDGQPPRVSVINAASRVSFGKSLRTSCSWRHGSSVPRIRAI